MNFETIKKNYDRNLWSKAMVRLLSEKGLSPKMSIRPSPAMSTPGS